jgi:hypothetical protein
VIKAETLGKYGCLLLLTAATLFTPLARGQNSNSGELRGLVTDASGAVVADVAVMITNVQTGVTTSTKTNGSGIYDAPSIPAGEYAVTFSKAGFRDFVRKGLTIEVGTTTIDATLQVGEASSRIEVTAEVPLLQTETSDQQTSFDTKAVLDAPIVGGIWFSELTKVLPGVGGGAGGQRDASGGEGIAVNGTQAYTANFQIEGSAATDPRDGNASDNFVPIDAIGEINVSTAGGAQNGNGLLTLNVNLKSGTNRWHGSVFEFVQNDKFNSRPYFDNTGPKPAQRWNEFGGSVGGPIIKNKLFFYFTYQRNPVGGGGFFQTTVPTDAMRNGDFTDPTFKATIYDKSSCAGKCARTPLNGGSNMILPGQIDSVSAAILKLIPVATNKTTNFNNFSAVVGTPSLGQWYVGKIDYQISKDHRLSGSVFEYPITLIFNPDALCGLGFDCTKSTPNNRNQSGRITETWTVTPTVVNEFRVGALREHDQYAPPSFGKDLPTAIGLEPTYGTNAPANVFPNITVNGSPLAVGSRTFIGGGVHANLIENIYNASDVLTLVRGKHTLKLGGELNRVFQHDTTWGDSSSGDFTFTGVGTNSGTSGDPRNGGAPSSGIPFADFLLGDVGTWNVFNGTPTNIASWITGAFVNDDYKVTPHLTLNLGLRYQHQTGYAVASNQFGNLDPNAANPGFFPAGFPATVLGALHFGGVNGHNTIEPSVNSWSPRLGVAWAPWQKWSFRASYGIFQVPRGTELYAHDNFPATLGLGFTPNGFIGDGSNVAFQLQTGPPAGSVTFPTAASLSPAAFNFKEIAFYAPQLPLQYSQQFLLSVQRELPWNNLIDVSFVHTKGTHLNFATDMNQVPAADLASPANVGDSTFGSPNFDRRFPQYQSILAHDFTGWSNYNALQVRFLRRFSNGLSYQFNYAWSKLMDTGTSSGHDQSLEIWQIAQNPRANYGLSQLDATNNFNGSTTYELPVGEGRRFPVHGILDRVVGGWRVTGIIQARSGVPYTATVGGTDPARSRSVDCFCGYALFANRVGSGTALSDFADPTNGGTTPSFGNAGRNILRGPGYFNLDMSIGKTLRIREGMSLEIRADSYNFLNHADFGIPDGNILSTFTQNGVPNVSHFGISSTVVSGARIFQLGGRFTF